MAVHRVQKVFNMRRVEPRSMCSIFIARQDHLVANFGCVKSFKYVLKKNSVIHFNIHLGADGICMPCMH